MQKARLILRYKSKYEMVGVLPIRIAKSNVSSVGPFVREKQKIMNLYKRDNHVTENKPIR